MLSLLHSHPSISSEVLARARQILKEIKKQIVPGNEYFYLETNNQTAEIAKIEKFAASARKKYSHVYVFGIGGSALGAKSLLQACASEQDFVSIVDNLDPVELANILHNKKLKQALFVVISKSGGTLETLAQFFLIQKKLGKDWQKNIVFVTDPKKGFLRELTTHNSQITTFSISSEIGGRFSVFTSASLLPAALGGVKIRQVLEGIKLANEEVALKLATSLFATKKNVFVLMPYAKQLKNFTLWWSQLFAESLGKTKKVGPTPFVALGPCDQHSLLQLLSDGPDDKFTIFLRVKKFAQDPFLPKKLSAEFSHIAGKKITDILNAESQATAQALSECNRPNLTLELSNLSPQSIGALLQTFLLTTAILGKLYGISIFGQPGVERGKVLAKEILKKGN